MSRHTERPLFSVCYILTKQYEGAERTQILGAYLSRVEAINELYRLENISDYATDWESLAGYEMVETSLAYPVEYND